jgi:hypothetical protein
VRNQKHCGRASSGTRRIATVDGKEFHWNDLDTGRESLVDAAELLSGNDRGLVGKPPSFCCSALAQDARYESMLRTETRPPMSSRHIQSSSL